MDIFKKLSPAEIKLLLDPNNVKVSELIKLTFLDLLIKQVLKVEIVDDEIHTIKQVSKSSAFDSYIPLKHEEIFIDAFKESPDMVLTLYETMKLVKSEITSSKNFKWNFLIEPRMQEYFKERPEYKLIEFFTGIRLSNKGTQLQKDVSSFLNEYGEKIKNKILTLEEMKILYQSIGSSFILIDGLDSTFIKETFEIVEKRKRKRNQADDISYTESSMSSDTDDDRENSYEIPAIPILGGVLVFELLEDIESLAESVSDSISTTFDSFDNSSWFGGDGDGGWFSGDGDGWGDSGCSGCGGCGGCGGD